MLTVLGGGAAALLVGTTTAQAATKSTCRDMTTGGSKATVCMVLDSVPNHGQQVSYIKLTVTGPNDGGKIQVWPKAKHVDGYGRVFSYSEFKLNTTAYQYNVRCNVYSGLSMWSPALYHPCGGMGGNGWMFFGAKRWNKAGQVVDTIEESDYIAIK